MAAVAITDLRQHLGYLKPSDIGRVEEAYQFSDAAHQGQFRLSGHPYISHPLAVAEIVADWQLDAQAVMAALLHDVMEDTAISKQQITERFGKPVAELVDGLSKLDKIEFQSQADAQAENFRKMLLAMARDVRVILIKLADRLHNMRTLGAVRPQTRKRVARETMEIYAPIANRLGLDGLYRELQELAFANLYPGRYKVLAKAVKGARGNRREVVNKVLAALKERLESSQIEAQVSGREKQIYSIYNKMHEKHLSFSQVLDIYGFRVIVKDVPACYLALGALHSLYKPVPGKFKDYIAIPKVNGYQSLHTTLIGPYGMPVEIQIRTQAMNRIAEAGVASHWLYKSDAEINEVQQRTHKWLQSLLDIQHASGDPAEFLEHIKVDLFPDEVYVFTPKGKIMAMPRGATAVDFAYAVHTDIGNRCAAARINYELAPLRTELKNGDRVEIITAAHANPNPAWLSYVKTGKARSQIRNFLKTMQYEEAAALGERMLTHAVRALGAKSSEATPEKWERLVRDLGAKSRQEVVADIGLGKRLAAIVARKLLALTDGSQADAKAPAGSIVIHGSEGLAVQFARCCNPIPGDPIIGFMKKGQGLVVHTHDCPTAAKSRGDPEKWLDVEWAPQTDKMFDVGIRVTVVNQRGVLAKVATAIAEGGSNIDNVSMDEERSLYTTMHFTLQVANRMHLAKVLRALRRVREVVRIARVKD
ncbi:MAG TPA: bifunctional (p)ppGpp synthetase/guanosine-3',5'-bis(diphosphate) 3'-pyrophosphohydrolase [Burkholderiales bacterium]|nr:bifunctional (p)ppGpp synthetase/guanosine-3',5'-bis(diphosphate) 3'-pyrophosphohydrolase [Burkholderiales bacterium]